MDSSGRRSTELAHGWPTVLVKGPRPVLKGDRGGQGAKNPIGLTTSTIRKRARRQPSALQRPRLDKLPAAVLPRQTCPMNMRRAAVTNGEIAAGGRGPGGGGHRRAWLSTCWC